MSSTQYPTPEERARIMQRRRALLDELMAPRSWFAQEDRAQLIERLKREYGSDETQRMVTISEELRGKSDYEQYLDLYRRFGGDRRLLKPGEFVDLHTKQAWLERYNGSTDPPLTPAQEERLKELTDLLMLDWPLWEDLVPENPPMDMPERIEVPHDYPPPLDELLTLGEGGAPGPILERLQPLEAYIPDLIRMALDLELQWASGDDPKVYAPTHAMRLLGMAGAEEAAEPLLAVLDLDQDWVPEELPHVYAGIGPAAIPHLQCYIADRDEFEYGRIRATEALKEIAVAHPTERDRVVGIARELLRQGRQVEGSLNAFLISGLIDLRAEEALDDIKADYLADKVDLSVVGNFNSVLQEFGLPPDPEVPSRSIWEGHPLADAIERVLPVTSEPMPPQPTRPPKAKAQPKARTRRRRARRTRRKKSRRLRKRKKR